MTRPDPRDRVVDAAVSRLHQRGLTVALDGISLEEAIADSGVARATAYRRWPNRAEFTREVLIRTVRSVRLEPEQQEDLGRIRELIRNGEEDLGSELGRRRMLVEALRIATAADHQRLSVSGQWRDYLALRVTCEGIPDEELRSALTLELREVEREFVQHRADVYARIPRLFGYRLWTPLSEDAGFALVAEITGALMTGLILHAAAGEPPRTFRARAFGSDLEAEWTTPSYALTATLMTHLEKEPDLKLDPELLVAHLDSMASERYEP